MAAKPGTRQAALNKSMPIAAKVKLGDVVAELIAQVNALTVQVNILAAASVPATPIISLELRV